MTCHCSKLWQIWHQSCYVKVNTPRGHITEIIYTCCYRTLTPPPLFNYSHVCLKFWFNALYVLPFRSLRTLLEPWTTTCFAGKFPCSLICHSISWTKYSRLPLHIAGCPACHMVKQNRPCCEVTATYEKCHKRWEEIKWWFRRVQAGGSWSHLITHLSLFFYCCYWTTTLSGCFYTFLSMG